jgi:hypothetical protein
MIRTIATLLAAGALAGCWGAPPNEKILNGLCVDLLTGDERIVEDIAGRAQTDVAGFCSCYAATIVADDAKTALHKDAISAMAEARKDGDRGVEDAARHVQDLIEAGEIDTFTEAQLDSTGDDFQRISNDMGSAGGSCPAS